MKINKTSVVTGAIGFALGMFIWTLTKPYADKVASKIQS